MTKYYLDEEGLERLVNYINDNLAGKVNVGDQVELPNDLVRTADLSSYALKSELPAEADLSGYATKAELDDYATDADIARLEGLVTGVYHFRGSVADLAELQAIENPAEGDVYNISDTGMNAAWTGSVWDEFGTTVDLTDYAKLEDIQAIAIARINEILFSGKTAVVNDAAAINAMLANNEEEVEITLNKNLTLGSSISVPEGKSVTIDLGGNTLSGNNPLRVEGGELILKNGNITAGNYGVIATSGSVVEVDGADITSTGNIAISATEAEVVVNSGNITAQECGIAGFKDSVITINGGTFESWDNCPIMGNGSKAGSQNDGTNMNVVMNGGTIISHIQSAGYIAAGVYVPNSGSFTMNGGEIISDGAGIVMRGGTVTLNGGSIQANGASGVKGKVGDSRVVVGPYAIVYDANSKYPAMDSLELIINEGVELEGTDGALDVLLIDGVEANITDNTGLYYNA